ncbi:Uncharacterised protein [uncultured archaeon]|nr:Uncharacterised protein [uncultured archaeon]
MCSRLLKFYGFDKVYSFNEDMTDIYQTKLSRYENDKLPELLKAFLFSEPSNSTEAETVFV